MTHDWSLLIGGRGDSSGRALAFDTAGNVIMGGDFRGEFQIGDLTWGGGLSVTDGFVAKFSSDGTFLWATRLESNQTDTIAAVAIDGSGDVFAVGVLERDLLIVSLSGQDGSIRWQKRFGNALRSQGLGVAVANQNTIIVGAEFQASIDFGGGDLESVGELDIALLAYDTEGNHLWSRRFGGSGSEKIGDLTVNGNVIALAGYFSGPTDLGSGPETASLSDIFLATYSTADGSPRWAKTIRGSGFDEARGVAPTDDGGFLLAGYFGQNGGSIDFGGGPLEQFGGADGFLARYSADGSFRWARSMGGESDDFVESVAVGPSGNISCAGYFQGVANMGGADLTSNGQFDAFLAEYDQNGQHRWSAAFGGIVSDRALAVVADQEIAISGFTLNTINFGGGVLVSDGFSDAFLAQFRPEGPVDNTPLPSPPTVTRTPTPTPIPNPPTPTPVLDPPTATATRTGTPTRTTTRTTTRTPTIVPVTTATRTATGTVTRTGTVTATITQTRTVTRTPTTTRTGSKTPTATRTATRTRTSTQPPTKTITRTPTKTRTPSATRTVTRTPTETRTMTATRTITATRTASATRTGTRTRTPTRTGTRTRTRTGTRTGTPTRTATTTRTGTATPPPATSTVTRTLPPTTTRTPSPAPTSTQPATPTPTPIQTRTRTRTQTLPPSATETPSAPPTRTPSSAPTATQTETTNPPVTITQEPIATATEPPPSTPTETSAPEPTNTERETETPPASATPSVQPTLIPVATHTVALPATHTPLAVDSICAGDCNGDSTVTLDELVQAINAALGLAANGICPLLDGNHDGLVAIDEVIRAVGSALEGCPTTIQ